MTPVRCVVVGLGAIGTQHARIAKTSAAVDLVGVVDQDRSRVVAASRAAGAPGFTSADEALSVRPEMAVVSVPTSRHFDVARELLRAGVNVLVEKPIAGCIEDADILIDLAKRRGVLLGVGHVERFNPAARELVRRVHAGDLGEVFHVHARRIGPFPPRVTDVGVVVDLATHDLDLFNWICEGDPARVCAETRSVLGRATEDLVSAMLRYPGGQLCVLDVNWITPTKVRELSVTGARGMLRADLLAQELYLHRARGDALAEVTSVQVDRVEPLRAQLEEFAAAVRGRRAPEITGDDGLRALRAAHRVLEAAFVSRPQADVVEIPEAGAGP